MTDSVIEFLRHTRKKERVRFRSDAKEINLSDMSIFELRIIEPGDLSELRILDLSENKLESIDLAFLRECMDLQILNLEKNQLQQVDVQSLTNLPRLEELDLSDNLMKQIDLTGLDGCNQLEAVDISGNHIHEIDLRFLDACPNLLSLSLQRNQLQSIDIASLAKCSKLEYLNLSHNWIRKVDLRPLSTARNLKHLDLSENPLESIDITPLSNCHVLENLILDWTQIQELDLSSLSECKNLRRIGISHNRVTEIDLYPLINSLKLEYLDISGINAMEIDLWPLFSLPRLDEFKVSKRTTLTIQAPRNSIPWSRGLEGLKKRIATLNISETVGEIGVSGLIKHIAKIEKKTGSLGKFYLRTAILESLNLHHLWGFDGNIINVLQSIGESFDILEVQKQVRLEILDRLKVQLQDGGSTHFIDMEKSRLIPDLAVLAPRVLELRKQEVESVKLQIDNGIVNLIPLWETSYGFEMLNALCIGFSTDNDGLNRIRKELRKLGIELNDPIEDDNSRRANKISDGLQQFIFMKAAQCSKE